MSEEIRKAVLNLKAISSIDSKIARILGEKKKLEDEIVEKKAAVNDAKSVAAARVKEYSDRKQAYGKEERFLRDEQAKLVDRRKALQSLQSYKLQQAAEKEIEAASKQLSAQEENLITMLDAVELLEKSAKEAQELLAGLSSELEALQKEAEESFVTLDERLEEHRKESAELKTETDPGALREYMRIADRYPMDAVVAFKGGACTGCYLTLGPQTTVQIGRAAEIVRCRGCGRILYLGQSEEE